MQGLNLALCGRTIFFFYNFIFFTFQVFYNLYYNIRLHYFMVSYNSSFTIFITIYYPLQSHHNYWLSNNSQETYIRGNKNHCGKRQGCAYTKVGVCVIRKTHCTAVTSWLRTYQQSLCFVFILTIVELIVSYFQTYSDFCSVNRGFLNVKLCQFPYCILLFTL